MFSVVPMISDELRYTKPVLRMGKLFIERFANKVLALLAFLTLVVVFDYDASAV